MGYYVASITYNILLTMIFTGGILCACYLYTLEKKPAFIALTAVFASYIVDNVIVFCTEMIPAFADVYDRLFLETPSIKTVCFIIRISGILYLLSCVLPSFKISAVLTISAIHAFSIICVPLISQPDWMVYCYYFVSQCIIICVSIWGLVMLQKSGDHGTNVERTLLKRVFLFFLLMSTLILIEDTYVIFFVDVYTHGGLNIFNRNISENILFIGCSIGVIAHTVRYVNALLLEKDSRPDDRNVDLEVKPDTVSAFASNYNLTDRELEILRCVLDGKSQQEISQTLVIALGTVKTHTHNIYSKVGATNRSQIIGRYQQFLDESVTNLN